MSRKDEEKFYTKIYILIVLTMMVIAGLLFFILSGSADTLRAAAHHTPETCPAVPDCNDSPSDTHVVPSDQPEDPDDGKDPGEDGNKNPEPGENTPDEGTDPSEQNEDPAPGENTPSEGTDPSDQNNTPSEEGNDSSEQGENSPDDGTDPADDGNGSPGTDETPAVPEDNTGRDIVSDDSLYKIVNPFHMIDPGYVPSDLRVVNVSSYQSQKLRSAAADHMEQMFAAAQNDGIGLYLISGYRSYERQIELWNWWTEHYGEAHAQRIDDHPGGSEHQIGLSADIGTPDHYCELNTCFDETGAYAWLRAHAWEYGYIERHPAGSENVTGIMYSPWSFRYVGREEAEKIHASGLSMEEYYGLAG